MPINDTSISGRYATLVTERQPYLDNGRRMAAYTVPSSLPEEPRNLPVPNQSIGSLGVNNLTSKFLLSLLPPNQLFFKLAVDEAVLQELDVTPEARTEIEKSLQKLEAIAVQDIDRLSLRTAVFTHLRNLIVSGGSVLFVPTRGGRPASTYRLDEFVAVTDRRGELIELILEETVDLRDLPDDVQAQLRAEPDADPQKRDEERPKFYTRIRRNPIDPLSDDEPTYLVEKAVEHVPIGDPVEFAASKLPWIYNQFPMNPGESYSFGFVQEYSGDLLAVDSLSQSVTEIAAVLAWAMILVKRTAGVKPDDINKAQNGAALYGDPEQVGMLRFDKAGDLGPAIGTMDTMRRSLGAAYLMASPMIRDAERVTTEEIRRIAQELEELQGGAYSYMARWLQKPLASLLVQRLEKSGAINRIPKSVRPQILTGFDALGRAREVAVLQDWVASASALFGDEGLIYFKVPLLLNEMARQRQLQADSYLRSDEEVAQIRQQQITQALIEKVGPQAVSGVLNPANVQSTSEALSTQET